MNICRCIKKSITVQYFITFFKGSLRFFLFRCFRTVLYRWLNTAPSRLPPVPRQPGGLPLPPLSPLPELKPLPGPPRTLCPLELSPTIQPGVSLPSSRLAGLMTTLSRRFLSPPPPPFPCLIVLRRPSAMSAKAVLVRGTGPDSFQIVSPPLPPY